MIAELRRLALNASLRWAVISALLIGLVFPTVISGLFNYKTITAQAERDLQRDLYRSADVLAISLATPLWDVNQPAAEVLIKSLTDDSRYVAATVHEKDTIRAFVETQRLSGVVGETRTLTKPITREGIVIGKVSLTMTKRPYLEQLDNEIRHELWRVTGTLLSSLLLILWVIRNRILKPMDLLTRAAEELSAGKLDTQLSISSRDEIGRVGNAMERMRQGLLNAFEALRLHASTLEDRVTQRTNELQNTNAELTNTLNHLKNAQSSLVESEKLASLGRLVAGVAHELNTPLGNAITVVSTIEDRFSELTAKVNNGTTLRKSELIELLNNTQKGHDLLRRNVEKAAELIRDFKQVAIDQSSEMRRHFDAKQVIEETLITIRPRFKHSPFKIETSLAEEIVMDSFPGPFGQVLTNLMLNSLTHAFEDRSSGTVRLTARQVTDSCVQILCEDDGIGMKESVRKRIFDPFFTTKMGRGGSGLGLNIVHNIVTGLLGGRIAVTSLPGQGTRFEITLPVQAPEIVSR